MSAGLSAGELPQTGGERPHATLTLDIAPHLPGSDGTPVGHTANGGVLIGSTLERILCDASITRVVTRGPSEVLDIGRKTRIVPPAIRRALAIRDGGCVGHNCDRPPAWTDAHHVIHWTRGGPTALDWLALLCRQHHIVVHDDGWVCVRDGTGWIALPPEIAADWQRGPAAIPSRMASLPIHARPASDLWLFQREVACPDR